MLNRSQDKRCKGLIPMIALGWAFSAVFFAAPMATAADSMPNACPVDGCEINIKEVKPSGDELEVVFEANFTPDVSKNHIHVWWGEKYTVEQSGRGAKRPSASRRAHGTGMTNIRPMSRRAPLRPLSGRARSRSASVPPTATTIFLT